MCVQTTQNLTWHQAYPPTCFHFPPSSFPVLIQPNTSPKNVLQNLPPNPLPTQNAPANGPSVPSGPDSISPTAKPAKHPKRKSTRRTSMPVHEGTYVDFCCSKDCCEKNLGYLERHMGRLRARYTAQKSRESRQRLRDAVKELEEARGEASALR